MKTHELSRFGLAAGLALALVPAAHAADLGTNSGVQIQNTATVDYKVGTVQQTQKTSNTTSFLVDRVINLTVTERNSAATVVVASATEKAVAFNVRNLSNDTIDILVGFTQRATGASAPFDAETDNFNIGGTIKLYLDVNTNGVYDSGTDTELPKDGSDYYLDAMAEDETRVVLVVGDIPDAHVLVGDTFDADGTVGDGDAAVIVLSGTARLTIDALNNNVSDPQAAALDDAIAQTVGADDPTKVDTVFNDGANAGLGDAVRNGIAVDDDQFNVATAELVVTKTATVIDDPVNGTSDPKAIPGATIVYCVVAENTGSVAATDVVIEDDLDLPTVQPVTVLSVETAEDATNNTCPDTATWGAGTTSRQVSETDASLPAGDFFSVKITVEID